MSDMDDELSKIKKILLEMWDPIGINKSSCPADEYDSYALQLYKLGQENNIKAIVEFLGRVEQEYLQLAPDLERNGQVARKIIDVFA